MVRLPSGVTGVEKPAALSSIFQAGATNPGHRHHRVAQQSRKPKINGGHWGRRRLSDYPTAEASGLATQGAETHQAETEQSQRGGLGNAILLLDFLHLDIHEGCGERGSSQAAGA